MRSCSVLNTKGIRLTESNRHLTHVRGKFKIDEKRRSLSRPRVHDDEMRGRSSAFALANIGYPNLLWSIMKAELSQKPQVAPNPGSVIQ